MTKIVENIIEKALEEGYANKNGRELKSQYQARYNKDSGTLGIVTGKQIGRAHV